MVLQNGLAPYNNPTKIVNEQSNLHYDESHVWCATQKVLGPTVWAVKLDWYHIWEGVCSFQNLLYYLPRDGLQGAGSPRAGSSMMTAGTPATPPARTSFADRPSAVLHQMASSCKKCSVFFIIMSTQRFPSLNVELLILFFPPAFYLAWQVNPQSRMLSFRSLLYTRLLTKFNPMSLRPDTQLHSFSKPILPRPAHTVRIFQIPLKRLYTIKTCVDLKLAVFLVSFLLLAIACGPGAGARQSWPGLRHCRHPYLRLLGHICMTHFPPTFPTHEGGGQPPHTEKSTCFWPLINTILLGMGGVRLNCVNWAMHLPLCQDQPLGVTVRQNSG